MLANFGYHLGCAPDAPETLAPTVAEVLDVARPSKTVTAADVAAALSARIGEAVTDYARNMPRSQQTRIGPSEIGHPCDRRIAYRLLEWAECNPGGDVFPSFIGTAAHSAMDKVFSDPRREGRYTVDEEITARPGLTGKLDLFDLVDGIVVDHKFVGTTSMRKYKTNGPSEQYRKQVHTYAAGKIAAGEDVAWVAIAFYPRGGFLKDRHVWVEAYDATIVDRALERLDNVAALSTMLDVKNTPANLAHVPIVAESCGFCPFYLPGGTNLAIGCPGDGSPSRRGGNVLAGLA